MKGFSFQFKNAGFSEIELRVAAKRLTPYLKKLRQIVKQKDYEEPESFLCLPFDQKIFYAIEAISEQKICDNLANLIICGIGGSSLGTDALSKALPGLLGIHFVGNLDGYYLEHVLATLEADYEADTHSLLIAVSKSGVTTETIANFSIFLDAFKKLDPDWNKHVICITDENSKLWNYAKTRHFDVLRIPKNVVGRYSVMSAASLLPLHLGGYDVFEIVEGAKMMTEMCLEEDLAVNPALQSAVSLFLHCQAKRSINNSFLFASELQAFGEWYRQLLGESLGKDGKGLTPLVSLGSADLHSVGQLYFDGPDDKVTTFVSVKNPEFDYTVGSGNQLGELVPNLEGKSLSEIMAAILHGVKDSYRKKQRPFLEIELDELSPFLMGALLQMKMIEVTLLAKLFGVDAFTQPAVEGYKRETARILGRKSAD